ncbi:MAG: acyltransferase [Bacteroidales bacterium]|nr:acyltransferase [Bacteroidales bacterium]
MKYRNLSHSVDELWRKIRRLLGKLNVYFAKWWGVTIGKRCVFFGKTYFKRFPGSIISIGDECEFLSAQNSNLIGINHRCRVTTLNENAVVKIGSRCGFSGTIIAASKSIILGDNVRCGANTLITDSDWHPEDPRSGKDKEVIIGNNVWLGVNVTVLKGVTIGDNCVIGAGSVVTKSIAANKMAAGNPCREIKDIVL